MDVIGFILTAVAAGCLWVGICLLVQSVSSALERAAVAQERIAKALEDQTALLYKERDARYGR